MDKTSKIQPVSATWSLRADSGFFRLGQMFFLGGRGSY